MYNLLIYKIKKPQTNIKMFKNPISANPEFSTPAG